MERHFSTNNLIFPVSVEARGEALHALMEAACAVQREALHECKRALGLLPRQCYPESGYNGSCDRAEFEWKQCLAYAANSRDAELLYNAQASRQERVAANARLQKALRKHNQPCVP